MNPDSQYSLWRFEQRRRDADLERRRAYRQAYRPDPLLNPFAVVSEARNVPLACEAPACGELVVAS